jgi:hypothetical protein
MQSSQHHSPTHECARNREIERRAYYLVDTHAHFQRRASRFEFHCTNDVLLVRGNVPTFYLKQVLQTVLQNVDGIRIVDNRVDVIASDGLSGVAR